MATHIRKNGCRKLTSVKRFSMRTGILIGTGNAFFSKGSDSHASAALPLRSLKGCSRSHTFVTFVATETLKNVLKPQGSRLCKHWWTYPTHAHCIARTQCHPAGLKSWLHFYIFRSVIHCILPCIICIDACCLIIRYLLSLPFIQFFPPFVPHFMSHMTLLALAFKQ